MKKKIVSLLIFATMISSPITKQKAFGQIIYINELDEDGYLRMRSDNPELPGIPELGVNIDQYAPLGGCAVWFLGLGGAYLLVKRKRE